MVEKFYCMANFLFFDILFCSYFLANLSSSIICLFADDIYISLSNFLSTSSSIAFVLSWTVPVTLSAVLLPIKSPLLLLLF